MPILGIFASSQQSAFIATGAYESIATVSVGSGGASSVSFTSIPATYKHLQVRGISRSDGNFSDIDSVAFRFNSDTGNNYSYHFINASGSGSVPSGSGVSQPAGLISPETGNLHTSGIFASFVVDILDYASTSKTKTIQALGGVDTNNQGVEKGVIRFTSSNWPNTSAITEITFRSGGGFDRGFTQYTQFALYGIKGA
jgi:hypothetical protein